MRIVATIAAVITVLAVNTVPAVADEITDLKVARANLETAFVNQDTDALLSLMTPDHIATTFTYGGTVTRDEQIASLPELKVTFSDVTEPRITVFGGETAYVTYAESLNGTFRGEPLPSRVFASELWVKQDGKWLEKAYQETVIDSQ